jgi:hypothetical protein
MIDEITMCSNVLLDPKVKITIKKNLKIFSDQEIEDFYHEFFGLTKTYPNSKRRSNYVAFTKAILQKAQKND